MDIFGIYPFIKGSLKNIFTAFRGTGRTTLMLEYLKDGDIVVFHHYTEARRVEKLCKEKGIKIYTVCANNLDLYKVIDQCRGLSGRLTYDHSFVEEYYMKAIEEAHIQLTELAKLQNRKVVSKDSSEIKNFQAVVFALRDV